MRQAFAVLRIQKLKTWGAVAGAGKHNERERETPNADPSKSADNQQLVTTASKDVVTSCRQLIGEQKIRKNAVLVVEMLISASPSYFRSANPEQAGSYNKERLERWRDTAMDWAKQKYGERIVSALLHLDESTPHIHLILVPLDEKGKLNCRSHFGGTRHTLSNLQTEYAEVLSQLGIERGIQNSQATHQKVSQYYTLTQTDKEIHLPQATQYSKLDRPNKITRMSDKELVAYEKKAVLSGITAQKAVDKKIITAVTNKNTLLENENKQLKQRNSKLFKEKTALQKEVDKLRGIEPGQVLSRLFKAKGPYSHEMGGQYYILPNKKEVKVSGARWQTDSRRGRGAIDLVMHLQGYTQIHMEKALA